MGRNRALAAFVAFVLSIAGLVAGSIATAGASATTVTVNQTSLAPNGPWSSPSGADTGTAGFKIPPVSPPAGTGALALNVPSGQHRAFYDYQYGICAAGPSCAGPYTTALSSVTSLGYSSYRIGASSALNAVPSFNIEIDTDPSNGGAVHYTTLVWEPSNNGGTLQDDQWQTWDAYNGGNGMFWATVAVPGVFPTAGAGGTQLTWNAIVSALPNAKIKYGIGLNVGTGPTFDGFADAVTIGLSGNDTVYDFETSVVTSTIGQGDTSLFPTPTTQWVSNDDNTAAAGDVSFVNGPGTPPAGVGSARFDTATASGASALEYLNFANAATRFSQISDLKYSTYRQSVDGGNNLAVALQFNADYDKADTTNTFQGRLVFEPYQGIGGNVPQNTWQTWSPLTGKWWMSASVTFPPKVGNVTVPNACPQALPCTWAQVLAAYPRAGFLNNPSSPQPFVILKAGSSWPGFVGNVDGLRLSIDGSEANFDLEPDCTTDCYVSSTGSDNNTGTATDPFATVGKAVSTVANLGTVHVGAGTFNVSSAISVNKSIAIVGANAGVSPNDPVTPTSPNPARGPESTLNATGVNRIFNISAPNVTVDGFRVTDAATTYANDTLIGAGVNFGGAASGVAVKNTTFFQPTRTVVYFNGPSPMTSGSIDDNRVENPIRTSDCGAGATANSICGHQLFNPWQTNNLSFQRNVALLGANDGGRIRVVNVNASNNATLKNNTITGKCIFTCITLAGTSTNADIESNDVTTSVGNVLQFFSDWSAGTATVTKNTFTDTTDYAVVVDGPAAVLSGVAVERNAIVGGGFRNSSSNTIDANCNWWGQATGPQLAQNTGPVTASQWLLTSNLNGPCPGPLPTVSVGSLSQLEGSGTDPVVNVPVTLSNAYGGTVTVQYATADGSGPTGAVAPNDYTPASGTVTFLGGETSKTVPVTIRGNLGSVQFDEKDETFSVVLSSPTNATLGTNPGTVTILNDDTPTVSLGASIISTVEGNAGTHNVQVPVSLTNPSTFPITVGYSTTSGTATAPSDYATASGTLTIPAGQVTASIPVTINSDTLDETNETFTVSISSPGGGGSVPPNLGNATQTVRITNDDTPTVSVSNAVIDSQEMNSGTHAVPVNVTLSNPSVVGITVSYATAPGSAVTPSDYVTASGTVTFAPGQTTKTFNVNVKGDTSLEDYEFFTVSISNPTAAATAPTVLGNAMEPIQILNDEKPSLTGTNVSGAEGSTLQFGATLVQRYYQNITVNYATANGTAMAPGDFTATSGAITFLAGTNGTQTVGVPTKFDFTTEVAEKFTMGWTSASIKVSPVTKTGTIKSNHT